MNRSKLLLKERKYRSMLLRRTWHEHRGAFTSLYLQGQLRGCVGYVFPIASVYRTVMETARAAAFEDRRFSPLQARRGAASAHFTEHSVAVASIRAEDVVVGRHGLLVTLGARRGLLFRRFPSNITGTCELSWSKPAIKPGCRETRGGRVRNSRRLPLKFLEKQERAAVTVF